MSSANEKDSQTAPAQEAQPAAAATNPPEASPSVPADGVGETPASPAAQGGSGPLDFVLDVPLRATVEIGSAEMRVAELLQVDKGSVIELDRLAGEPADILVNGRFVARGEVTVVDDRLAVRILEIDGRSVGRGEG